MIINSRGSRGCFVIRINKWLKSVRRCSDLPGSRLPLTGAAIPRSGRWCRSLSEAVASKNRQCYFAGICPAFVCGAPAWVVWVPAWVVWVSAAVGKLVPEAVDRYLTPAVASGEVPACFGLASGFGGNCHRVVEHTGYTWTSPGKRKIDSLGSQNRSGDLCHSGGPHGVFQLLDPLAA